MTNISLRGMLLVAVSAISLAACSSQSTKADLTSRLDAANATIEANNATISQKQAAIDAANASISSLQADKVVLQASISSLQAEKVALQASLDAANATIAERQAALGAANATIAQKQAALDAANASIASLQASITSLQDQIKNYNKTAANALADKMDNAHGGYKRSVTVSESDVQEAKDQVASAMDAITTAQSIAEDAQIKLDDANNNAPNPTYVGATLATYYANDKAGAEKYADLLRLDVTDSSDQGLIVSTAAYQAEVTSRQTALATAQADIATANTNLSNAKVNLSAVKSGYDADRVAQQSGSVTLYQADGTAVSAEGAMIYNKTLDAAAVGDQVPEAARITSLFLLDANGAPTKVLVFDATAKVPFSLPVGAASFTSDSMVAYFAQLEGAEDGTNIYTLKNDPNAGSLTINFNDNTGHLTLTGLTNGSNQDYSVSANLTFDPVSGKFGADGVNQAYTSTDGAEIAKASIAGALSGAGEAFVANIDATDKTAIGNVDVKIMTRIAGTGSSN